MKNKRPKKVIFIVSQSLPGQRNITPYMPCKPVSTMTDDVCGSWSGFSYLPSDNSATWGPVCELPFYTSVSSPVPQSLLPNFLINFRLKLILERGHTALKTMFMIYSKEEFIAIFFLLKFRNKQNCELLLSWSFPESPENSNGAVLVILQMETAV